MKKLRFSTLILSALLFASGCRTKDFDPNLGIYIQMDIQAEAINANATKSGESFDFTRNMNLRDTFKNRYNIDPDKLETFFVEAVTVALNKDNCDKLSAYEITLTMPGLTSYTFNKAQLGCSLPKYLSLYPTIFSVDKSTTNPLFTPIVTTNYAASIKGGKFFSTRFKMTAGQDLAAGDSGVLIILKTRATYKP